MATAKKHKVIAMKDLLKPMPGLATAATKFKATRESLEQALNKLAEDGFELVQIQEGYGDSYVILKKCDK
jgi:hypothetical protein